MENEVAGIEDYISSLFITWVQAQIEKGFQDFSTLSSKTLTPMHPINPCWNRWKQCERHLKRIAFCPRYPCCFWKAPRMSNYWDQTFNGLHFFHHCCNCSLCSFLCSLCIGLRMLLNENEKLNERSKIVSNEFWFWCFIVVGVNFWSLDYLFPSSWETWALVSEKIGRGKFEASSQYSCWCDKWIAKDFCLLSRIFDINGWDRFLKDENRTSKIKS